MNRPIRDPSDDGVTTSTPADTNRRHVACRRGFAVSSNKGADHLIAFPKQSCKPIGNPHWPRTCAHSYSGRSLAVAIQQADDATLVLSDRRHCLLPSPPRRTTMTRPPEYARPATAGRSDEHTEKTHWLILRVQGGAGIMRRTRSVPSSRTTT